MKISKIFKSTKVEFELDFCNFTALLCDDTLPDSLVRFNPIENRVTVDSRADKQYGIYAGLHECICCGNYQELAPTGAKGINRCGMIDLMLIECMPKDYAPVYRKKRIEMFYALIERNLNPVMNHQFERAIAILEGHN